MLMKIMRHSTQYSYGVFRQSMVLYDTSHIKYSSMSRYLFYILFLSVNIFVAMSSTSLVYFGTGSDQVFSSRFDETTGQLSEPVGTTVGSTPTWLTANLQKDQLFMVHEETGRLSSYNFNRTTGELVKINEVANFGGATCHCELDSTQALLGAVNYLSGNFDFHTVNADGSIIETPVFSHQGEDGVAHPHQIFFTDDYRYLFVPDLGLDVILQYEFDAANVDAPVRPNRFQPTLPIKKGAGPRHLTFSPTRSDVLFGSNELDSTLNVYLLNRLQGTLELVQSISTLLPTFNGTNSVAEIVASKCGKFVYVSNRGDDSIAKFRVHYADSSNDGLSSSGHDVPHVTLESVTPCGGSWPRFIGFDLSHQYLMSTNQKSNSVAVFSVDADSGELTFKYSVPMPSPQHALFIPV